MSQVLISESVIPSPTAYCLFLSHPNKPDEGYERRLIEGLREIFSALAPGEPVTLQLELGLSVWCSPLDYRQIRERATSVENTLGLPTGTAMNALFTGKLPVAMRTYIADAVRNEAPAIEAQLASNFPEVLGDYGHTLLVEFLLEENSRRHVRVTVEHPPWVSWVHRASATCWRVKTLSDLPWSTEEDSLQSAWNWVSLETFGAKTRDDATAALWAEPPRSSVVFIRGLLHGAFLPAFLQQRGARAVVTQQASAPELSHPLLQFASGGAVRLNSPEARTLLRRALLEQCLPEPLPRDFDFDRLEAPVLDNWWGACIHSSRALSEIRERSRQWFGTKFE